MILLDTDILIDLLRANIHRTSWFKNKFQREEVFSISLVTKLELLRGCKSKMERTTLKDWFGSFHVIHINESISQKAEEIFERYHPKQGIGILDAMIAATALHHACTFYTGNQKHFRNIQGLTVKGPD